MAGRKRKQNLRNFALAKTQKTEHTELESVDENKPQEPKVEEDKTAKKVDANSEITQSQNG